MIVTAMIGILATLGGSMRQAGQAAAAELQRERALLLLEYHAACLSTGAPVDPAVDARLRGDLPGGELTRQVDADVVTLTATWRDPRGAPASRALAVFARPVFP